MALTWEKWRELFKGKWADVFEDAGVETGGEVTAENFEGILPEEKGGLGADNFNQGRGNLMDITGQITSENLNDVNFYRQFKGRTVAVINSEKTQNGTLGPTSWGTLTTEVAGSGNNYTQAWQDAGGTRFVRSANGNGWSNDPSLNGKDAWTRIMTGDIQRGLFINLSVPANGVLTHTINFPRPFVSVPPKLFLSAQRYAATSNLSAHIGQVSNTQGIAYVRNNLNVTEGINLHWMAIG